MKFSTRELVTIPLFTALMVIGAKISIPTPFIVITLQLFFSIYTGLLLTPRNALIAQVLYVVIGLIGLPVFSYGGGIQYVFNPTFGFVLGFVLCSWVVAVIVGKPQRLTIWRAIAAVVAGLAIDYVIGTTYLYMVKNIYTGQAISYLAVWAMMIIPIVKDILLGIIAAYTAVLIVPKIK